MFHFVRLSAIGVQDDYAKWARIRKETEIWRSPS